MYLAPYILHLQPLHLDCMTWSRLGQISNGCLSHHSWHCQTGWLHNRLPNCASIPTLPLNRTLGFTLFARRIPITLKLNHTQTYSVSSAQREKRMHGGFIWLDVWLMLVYFNLLQHEFIGAQEGRWRTIGEWEKANKCPPPSQEGNFNVNSWLHVEGVEEDGVYLDR